MKMIKLAVGVTPTCWRPPYGDIDDRVRYIANALGLRSILWQYDSNDWQVGSTSTTPAQVDANYQNLITAAQNGTFNTVGAIILTHELNNFTMQEAIKFYPLLKQAFKNLVPVGVGWNWTQPYVETNYSLPNFQQCRKLFLRDLVYTDMFFILIDVSGEVVSTSTISSSGSTASSSASAKGGSSSNDATSMMIPTLLVLMMMGGSALSLVL